MVYKKARKGAQGIGTLIIFIALILVAAVAAGVLISTVGKLQGKAENTATQVQQKLGTGFDIFEVTVQNTNDSYINKTIDTFQVSLQLSPGSDAVKLNDVIITLVTSSGTNSYTYNDSALTASSFNSTYIKGGNLVGYISGADTITFQFQSGSDIGENQEFTVRLFPGTGNPIPVKLLTPPAMVDKYTILK